MQGHFSRGWWGVIGGSLLVALFFAAAAAAEPIDDKYPLGDDLRVLEIDAKSPDYAQLVAGMNGHDLDAEWRRLETRDNPESFAAKHGGKEKVLADADLQRAYERRVAIRDSYLALMRAEYAKRKQTAPFDKGQAAEKAGTMAKSLAAGDVKLAFVWPSPGAERQWPRFRGPTGQGIAPDSERFAWPTEWTTEKNIVWKTELPGDGNSSPVIWNDQLFLTTSGAEGSRRAVHALDLASGKLLWSSEVPAHQVEPQVRDKNGFASSTPVVDGERIISYFGAGGLLCHDLAGKLLWHYSTPDFNSMWGSAASPLLYENLVILVHDQNRGNSLCVALDKATGKLVWSRPRAKAMGWCTPVVVRIGERNELVYAGGETLKGYDPRTGEELWTLDGPTKEVVPTVVIGPELIYSASGRQGPTLGVRPGGRGNVNDTHVAWRAVRGGPHVPSPVLFGGRLYVINDFGIASCLDAQSGELVYQDRLRDKFSASGIEAGGKLYFGSESGLIYVVEPGDKLTVVATNDLKEPILASPAALGGRLYVRAGKTLYCVGK
ncbi:MAG: PQQ-binding-like beta-propeller repeat protein [Pirellulaceae bacterium]|nr:PQQ-binding-like beta-propeller repeat protein [Pirellulaceae bacterium]